MKNKNFKIASLVFCFFSFMFLLAFASVPLYNLFFKRENLKDHKEDFYLLVLAIVFIFLIYLFDLNGLNIFISVVSSLANSGISLIKSDNNLSLYFLLITIIGGSLISNSSGIKLTRFYILLKITSGEVIKLISPNSVIKKTIFNSDNKITDENIKFSFLIFR